MQFFGARWHGKLHIYCYYFTTVHLMHFLTQDGARGGAADLRRRNEG
jgi:hypothetical protein